jgi:hypothetical protein
MWGQHDVHRKGRDQEDDEEISRRRTATSCQEKEKRINELELLF